LKKEEGLEMKNNTIIESKSWKDNVIGVLVHWFRGYNKVGTPITMIYNENTSKDDILKLSKYFEKSLNGTDINDHAYTMEEIKNEK
jgi:hypothetical protein